MMAAKNLSPPRAVALSFGDGPGIKVDLDRLVLSRGLVQANSGAGKSHFLRAMLEGTHGRIQQFVIDPEGEFASLREKFDYVLAAKTGGDVEASAKTAALLVRRLVELRASAIFDLYDLSRDERREFIRRAYTELVALPRALWRPILVAHDEIHDSAPEKGHGEAVSLPAVTDMATLGRKRGYCLFGATQRISKVHKDVAAELLNKFVGRTSLDLDLKRAGDELGMDKVARNALKTLGKGEFYCYGPAVSNEVVLVHSPSALLTSHPKAGVVSALPPPAPAKVRAMLAQLADLPKEAENQERSIEALERENRDLKRQVAAKPHVEVPVTKIERVEVPVVGKEEADRLNHICRDFLERAIEVTRAAAEVTKAAEGIRAELVKVHNHRVTQAPGKTVPNPGHLSEAPRRPMPARAASTPPPEGAAPGLKKGAREMLRILAAAHPQSLTRQELGILAGIAHKGGTMNRYLSALRSQGLITYSEGGDQEITSEGMKAAPTPFDLPTSHEVVALWSPRFKAGARRMLEELIRTGGISRDDLGQAVGIEPGSGTMNRYLSALRSSGLVLKEGNKPHHAIFLGDR